MGANVGTPNAMSPGLTPNSGDGLEFFLMGPDPGKRFFKGHGAADTEPLHVIAAKLCQ